MIYVAKASLELETEIEKELKLPDPTEGIAKALKIPATGDSNDSRAS